MGDQAQNILAPLQVSDDTKALAWDAFHGAKDENDLATKLNSMGLPDSVKADLWDAKRQQGVHTAGPGVVVPPQQGSAPLAWQDSIGANTMSNILSGGSKSADQSARSALAPNGTPSILGKFLASVVPGFAKEGSGLAGIGDNPDPQNPVAPGLQINKATGYDPLAPTGVAQKVGAAGEQALEMLLMGKIAPSGNSLATHMLSSGAQASADAALHNQDPRIAGAIGGIAGAMSPLAQKLTGAALNTTSQQARIVLSELTGITPNQISKQAATKSLGLTRQMEQMAVDADARFAAANPSPPLTKAAAAGESAIDEATRGGPGTAPAMQPSANTYVRPGGNTSEAIAEQVRLAKGGTNGSSAAVSDSQRLASAANNNSPADVERLSQAAAQKLFGKNYNELGGMDRLSAIREATAMQTAERAQNAAGNITAQPQSPGGIASTKPALDVLDREMNKAITQNNQPYYEQLSKIKNQLTIEFSTGDPIGQAVPAKKILDLKRGVGGLINSWDAPARNQTRSVIKEVYGALDSELDKAAPGISDLNDMIHNLIGVKTAAAKTAKQASGAAFLGNLRRGEVGAIATRPLSSPTAIVGAARAVNSPITQSGVKGLALQLSNYPQLQQALEQANALPPENQ